MELTNEQLASYIDHTLLRADATQKEILQLCQEAIQYHFASVCVNSSHIEEVTKRLKNSTVKPVAVVGFPLGASGTAAKAYEAATAVEAGAQEIDMVISIGAMKDQNYTYVLQDIERVVASSGCFPVKVILEMSSLNLDQKMIGCALAKAAGAAFVKTSTGFGSGGATVEDIALMSRIVGNSMGIKASGGIRNRQEALQMIKAGATRLGTSASVGIVTETVDANLKSY